VVQSAAPVARRSASLTEYPSATSTGDLEPILVFRRGLPLRPHIALTTPINPKAFDTRHSSPYADVVLTAAIEFAFRRTLRTDAPVCPFGLCVIGDQLQVAIFATLRTSSASRAQPAPPFAQCPLGDRLGVLPRNLQEQAEVFELDDQLVLAGDQLVGAFAFALKVRSVPGRALLLGGKLGFELLDPCPECGDHIGHRLAAW
jgi:hypothetical protein